ncbi:glycosyltransferase [Haloarcula salinisoli]|uniref:Glycosyltransferase n=1 Tax=Haloarcula salinisoli TaxID=2487746 RepID=A0A8J7YJA6_9EURY|nr:glycosyltransferase [Halomicroarcula salinisoli]MBX0285625.1 glycosyltransferase [Halomicroarcula salinisoli]MBX0302886.1 glycosyltransferase [Halomicroarcula salinisoli]
MSDHAGGTTSRESTAGTHDASDTAVDGQSLPRVAFFTPAPSFGGAQRVTVTIANSLAQRGHDVDLVAGRLEGEFADVISDAVNTVELDVPEVPGVGILAGIPKLVSYLDARQPAVLFASRTHTNLAAVATGALADVDVHVAITEHSPFDYQATAKDSATAAIASHFYTYADDVITVSEGVAETVVENTRVSTDRTTVLNNPIDIAAIRSGAEEPVDHEWLDDPDLEPIVSVGRLEPVKGFSTLLEAFAELHVSRPETRLILVGKGPDRERLTSLARELGVADSVSLPGYTDNPYAYMGRASVYVLSSAVEGLPTVLIEALACGCTIVSTDCQYGPREILEDGRYGRLTPVGDAEALAETIGDALEDPTPPERSRERAQHFSMAAGADRYESYIASVTDD